MTRSTEPPITISRWGMRALFAKRLAPAKRYRDALQEIVNRGDGVSRQIAYRALNPDHEEAGVPL